MKKKLLVVMLLVLSGLSCYGDPNGDTLSFVEASSTPEEIRSRLEAEVGDTLTELEYLSFSYDYLSGKWYVMFFSRSGDETGDFDYTIDDKPPHEVTVNYLL